MTARTSVSVPRARAAEAGSGQDRLERLTARFEQSAVAQAVLDVDGRVTAANPALRRLLGVLSDDAVDPALRSLRVEGPGGRLATALQPLVEGRQASACLPASLPRPDGELPLDLEMSLVRDADDRPLEVVLVVRGVSRGAEAEEALRASEARYRAVVELSDEGVWVGAPDGRTLFASARLAEVLGLPVEQLYASSLPALLAGGAREQALERSERGHLERDEVRYLHPDGDERWLRVAAVPMASPDGQVHGSVRTVSDVTALRRAALHDPLTGLANRALLLERLDHALAREQVGTAVVLLDLDRFKDVNDARGHEAADRLLVAVAQRLRAAARDQDTVARVGGDEFVVVCEDVDEQRAAQRAEALLAALAGPVELDGTPVHVQASVGVAVSPADTAGDLLRHAGTAVLSAKAAGRGRVHLFDPARSQDADARLALAQDLRTALEQEALELHYQPVLDLTTAAVVGVEALARWRRPDGSDVPPSTFVPLAEATGQALELDRWVLRRAVTEVAALRAAGTLPRDAYVSVNLTPVTLTDPGLEELLLTATAETGLPASQVVLEVTERAGPDGRGPAVETMGRLRAHGFGIAVDDFGSGYSALSSLRDLPVTALKLDRSVLADIVDDKDALAIVASVVSLARAVGVSTVAEGVETEEQAALLRGLGCSAAQGWLWAPAVAMESVRTAMVWSRTSAPAARAARRSARPGRELTDAHGLAHLLSLHEQGASLDTIAAALNRDRFRTPVGTRWHRTSVAQAIAGATFPSLRPAQEA